MRKTRFATLKSDHLPQWAIAFPYSEFPKHLTFPLAHPHRALNDNPTRRFRSRQRRWLRFIWQFKEGYLVALDRRDGPKVAKLRFGAI